MRSTPRSRPAPTSSASCSFRRRRAMSTSSGDAPWVQRVQGRAKKVALSVDADDADLDSDRRCAQARPAAASRQGDAGARGGGAQARFGLPVMKALPVETAPTSRRSGSTPGSPTGSCSMPARRARPPGPAGSAGPSTGHLLKALDPGVPFMLSGGLEPAMSAQALEITRAPAVDVSSGVESVPGVKDPDKIRAFVRAVRAAETRARPESWRATHDRPAAQFLPHRPRRARAFRHLWRTLRRRDADAADPRTGEGLRAAPRRSGVPEGDGRPSQALCRPAVAALFRRAALRALSAQDGLRRAPKSTSSARTSITPARTR